jgi:myo-inositol-1(or 4)-monophosphatase
MTETERLDLPALREAVEAIARAAGAEVMRIFDQPRIETAKGSLKDVVTDGDKASEAVIVPALRALLPDVPVVSEEGMGSDTHSAASGMTWFVDPIDGTTNFAAKMPFFAISIGLCEGTPDHAGAPLVGVVYNPYYNEMFSAARGHGATLNGVPLHVSSVDTLERGVFISGFSTSQDHAGRQLQRWIKMMAITRDLRRFGSAALDMCYVAAGRAEGYWEEHIHAWDCAAGLLMVSEAGGTITNLRGTQDVLLYSGEEIVVTNGILHAHVLHALKLSPAQNPV